MVINVQERQKKNEKRNVVHIHSAAKMWFNSFILQHWLTMPTQLTHSPRYYTLTIGTKCGAYFHFNAVTISTNYDQSLNVCEQCAIRFYVHLHFRAAEFISLLHNRSKILSELYSLHTIYTQTHTHTHSF